MFRHISYIEKKFKSQGPRTIYLSLSQVPMLLKVYMHETVLPSERAKIREFSKLHVILVHCDNKISQVDCWKTIEIYCPITLEAEVLRSRCWQDCCLLEGESVPILLLESCSYCIYSGFSHPLASLRFLPLFTWNIFGLISIFVSL